MALFVPSFSSYVPDFGMALLLKKSYQFPNLEMSRGATMKFLTNIKLYKSKF